ncbi:von Willebrand factor C and EGF domain-containing protein [Periplaneta americana]|uniref:von Willebrand factor C and EGF domain-containing protein n=1 Tax=Periplaneta americana TaxID=6978 RepID=UPI0037E76B00
MTITLHYRLEIDLLTYYRTGHVTPQFSNVAVTRRPLNETATSSTFVRPPYSSLDPKFVGEAPAPTTVLPPGVILQLEDAQETLNQTNPDPCTVAGTQYNHGQQVPREDPCEFCLCLDGELFCWWQDCPPSNSGPCRSSRSFSACANASSTHDTTTATPEATVTSAGSSATSPLTSNGHQLTEMTQLTTLPSATTATASPRSTAPTTCYVMGTEYKVGEVLPRDTGTCLECVCDNEARVTCSPKDCATHDDYRSSSSLDMFDVDTF